MVLQLFPPRTTGALFSISRSLRARVITRSRPQRSRLHWSPSRFRLRGSAARLRVRESLGTVESDEPPRDVDEPPSLPFCGNNLEWPNGSQRWVPSLSDAFARIYNPSRPRITEHHLLNAKNAFSDRTIFPENQRGHLTSTKRSIYTRLS